MPTPPHTGALSDGHVSRSLLPCLVLMPRSPSLPQTRPLSLRRVWTSSYHCALGPRATTQGVPVELRTDLPLLPL